MKTTLISSSLIIFIFLLTTSCMDYEDDGPIQYKEENFTITDFNRVDVSDAIVIEIKQAEYYSIKARGDRRNLDDLQVRKSGNTLLVHFEDWDNRQHTTYLEITMPRLLAANLSGATNSNTYGFTNLDHFDLQLSGAAIAQTHVLTESISINLSGASILNLRGRATEAQQTLSGASSLKALDFQADEVNISVSGASVAKIWATMQLKANVSGASLVSYKGNPSIESQVTDSSVLRKE